MLVRSLLDRIPIAERSQAVQDAVHSLGPESSLANVSLAVSLLAAHPVDAARSDLLSYLRDAVERRAFNVVETACEGDSDLKEQLLDLVTTRLAGVAKSFLQKADGAVRVSMNSIVDAEQCFPGVEEVLSLIHI